MPTLSWLRILWQINGFFPVCSTPLRALPKMLEKFELGEAGRMIYDFIWGQVCDWYIELAKPRLYNKEKRRKSVQPHSMFWQPY